MRHVMSNDVGDETHYRYSSPELKNDLNRLNSSVHSCLRKLQPARVCMVVREGGSSWGGGKTKTHKLDQLRSRRIKALDFFRHPSKKQTLPGVEVRSMAL